MAPSAHNNVLDGGIMMDSGNADRWDHPQHGGAAASTASGSRADSAASSAMWAEAGSGGGGGYPNSNGGQTRCAGAGGGWASADSNNGDRRRWEGEMQHPGSWKVAAVERAAKVARTVDLQREQDVRGSDERGGEVADGGEAVKPAVVDPRDRETSGGLDHQDVEVVGLLQRMAKKSQDSPSRSPLGTEVAQKGPSTSTPLMQSRWEAPAVSNLASRAQPFRMSLSSPQAGSETHEAEQEVSGAIRHAALASTLINTFFPLVSQQQELYHVVKEGIKEEQESALELTTKPLEVLYLKNVQNANFENDVLRIGNFLRTIRHLRWRVLRVGRRSK